MPSAMLNAANRLGGAVPDVVVGAPLGHAGHHRQHRLGAVQGLHAGLLVHAQHHRRLRRVVVEPDHIDDLVHELRVGGELEEVLHVRLELELPPDPPDRRRATARCARPSRPVTSAWRWAGSAPAWRSRRPRPGRAGSTADGPGRGSSTSPSSRCATNRPRQRVTVPGVTRNRAATSAFDHPSAQASTIFDRSANACAVFARRDHRVSCSRSASVNTSSAFGRPGRRPSTSPAHRAWANRLRQAPTVIVVTPSSPRRRSYTTPGSAHASTIFARTANRADPPCDHPSNCARSASVNTNSAVDTLRTGHPETIAIRSIISGATH